MEGRRTTSKPATFSINSRPGRASDTDKEGRTSLMRCRNDLARGSPLSLGIGLRMVYGWQDGDKSQRSAAYGTRFSAVNVDMSTYVIFSRYSILEGGRVWTCFTIVSGKL